MAQILNTFFLVLSILLILKYIIKIVFRVVMNPFDTDLKPIKINIYEEISLFLCTSYILTNIFI